MKLLKVEYFETRKILEVENRNILGLEVVRREGSAGKIGRAERRLGPRPGARPPSPRMSRANNAPPQRHEQ